MLRVGDLLYLGTELDAANRRALSELNITRVLNVGVPQTINHFVADGALTYLSVEVFDNAASNFATVVLQRAIPFLDQGVRAGAATLVHCKTRRSKSPAVLVAWLMMRAQLSLVDAFRVLGVGPVSDALLGELVLLERALPEGRPLLPTASLVGGVPPLSWLACEGREAEVVASFTTRFTLPHGLRWEPAVHTLPPFDVLRVMTLHQSGWDPCVLMRRAAWEAVPLLLPEPDGVSCAQLDALLRTCSPFLAGPVLCAVAQRMAPHRVRLSVASAHAVDEALRVRSDVARERVEAAVAQLVRLRTLLDVDVMGFELQRLAAERLLSAATANELDCDLETHAATMLGTALSESWGQRLRAMVGDLSSPHPVSSAPLNSLRVLRAPGWASCVGGSGAAAAVALPPPMAAAFAQASAELEPTQKQQPLALLAMRGTVEMRYGDRTTLVMPTDCACVVWAFNHHDVLSLADLVAVSGVQPDRVRHLMTKLVQWRVFLRAIDPASERWAVNAKFSAKQRRIVIE